MTSDKICGDTWKLLAKLFLRWNIWGRRFVRSTETSLDDGDVRPTPLGKAFCNKCRLFVGHSGVCVRDAFVCVYVFRDICIEAAKLVRGAEQMPHTPLNGGLSRTWPMRASEFYAASSTVLIGLLATIPFNKFSHNYWGGQSIGVRNAHPIIRFWPVLNSPYQSSYKRHTDFPIELSQSNDRPPKKWVHSAKTYLNC